MKRLKIAILACTALASANANAAIYVKYNIAVTGTGNGAGSASNTNVPAYFTFSNTYTVYTYSGQDTFSSTTTAPIYSFSLTSSGFDINAKLVNATNTYGHLILAINPNAFLTTDVPTLTTSDILQSASSLTFSNSGYGNYTALNYTITTTTQSTPFLGNANPRLSFSIADTPATAPVPEAAAWAMMVLGMGAIGFAMRRQKSPTRVSYAA